VVGIAPSGGIIAQGCGIGIGGQGGNTGQGCGINGCTGNGNGCIVVGSGVVGSIVVIGSVVAGSSITGMQGCGGGKGAAQGCGATNPALSAAHGSCDTFMSRNANLVSACVCSNTIASKPGAVSEIEAVSTKSFFTMDAMKPRDTKGSCWARGFRYA